MVSVLGFIPLPANNGRQAVEIAQRERPSLIFMDLVMPTMNGYAAINELHSHPLTHAIPVIVISSHADVLSPQFHLPGVVSMMCKGAISMRDIARQIALTGLGINEAWLAV
jgi:CheY-like chemotaxis protein